MHYVAVVKTPQGESEHEVEINEVEHGRYQISIDGRAMEVDAHAISDNTLSLLLDHQAHNIEYEQNPSGGENLLVRGYVAHVEAVDLRTMRLRKSQATVAGFEGPATITSPMPGKVVAVLIKEGQQVVEGQGLVVVEAMKMENELKAPRAGTIKKLVANQGAPVEGGALLCVVE